MSVRLTSVSLPQTVHLVFRPDLGGFCLFSYAPKQPVLQNSWKASLESTWATMVPFIFVISLKNISEIPKDQKTNNSKLLQIFSNTNSTYFSLSAKHDTNNKLVLYLNLVWEMFRPHLYTHYNVQIKTCLLFNVVPTALDRHSLLAHGAALLGGGFVWKGRETGGGAEQVCGAFTLIGCLSFL